MLFFILQLHLCQERTLRFLRVGLVKPLPVLHRLPAPRCRTGKGFTWANREMSTPNRVLHKDVLDSLTSPDEVIWLLFVPCTMGRCWLSVAVPHLLRLYSTYVVHSWYARILLCSAVGPAAPPF